MPLGACRDDPVVFKMLSAVKSGGRKAVGEVGATSGCPKIRSLVPGSEIGNAGLATRHVRGRFTRVGDSVLSVSCVRQKRQAQAALR